VFSKKLSRIAFGVSDQFCVNSNEHFLVANEAEQAPDNKTISIDATYLKAHRTASSLRLKKGGVDA
jgi:hypothetical protein